MDSKEGVDNGINGKRTRDEPDSVQDNVVSNAIRDKRNREDTVDIKVQAQKDQRGKQRNAVDPSKLTPEYIAAQRALREERKRQKRHEQTKSTETAQHNSPIQNEFSTNFIKRPMLRLPYMVEFSDSTPVRIMSYNVSP
jgi:RNA exonuclease NGL2